MADTEEPQYTSLSQRIAALNQSQNNQTTTFGKRPPPPIPTSSSNRPALQSRNQTINNPPIVTYGSSVTKQTNNQPTGVKNLLPPPPVDRDNPTSTARSPSFPARNLPPPLPGRKGSQASPALPPRKTSTQLTRRGSNSSMASVSSTISGMSLGRVSTATSASSPETQVGRKLPPPLEQAKLPPLPPTRREREETAKANKSALVSTKSTPNLPVRQPPVVERDLAPKMPARPSLPARPVSRNNGVREEAPPVQPPRRLPPPAAATRDILSMGFNNKKTPSVNTETPNAAPRSAPSYSTRPNLTSNGRSAGPAVQELTERDFDRIALSGTPAFVDFYAPYCKYCVELDPEWQQLGRNFAHVADSVVIAKVDVDKSKSFMSRFREIQGYPTILYFDGHSEVPEIYQWERKLERLTDFLEEKTGLSARDGGTGLQKAVPPPIPMSTRPTIPMSTRPSTAKIQALSRPAPTVTPTTGCLWCRDFSEPDRVASLYTRNQLPRNGDQTGYLAEVLCGPFGSYTDKARAIFTWLHHNIDYDTKNFFAKTVNYGATPTDVINSGLAVCGGYAGLYAAIALKAGMECVSVHGHGKGFGHTPLKAGDPIPPVDFNHAWNAVRIDGGEWKLLDSCWGAGHLGENKTYTRQFDPLQFTMSNDDIGLRHFPKDDAYFFRSDGRSQSWEDYMIGPIRDEPLQVYSSVGREHGLSGTSFSPPQKQIPVYSGEVVRFQFSKVCEHWDNERNGAGKPYQMVLKIRGVDGRKDDLIPFENNDFWWWLDVHAKDLGAPGQNVHIYAVTTINGKDARGMSKQEYLKNKGRCGYTLGGVCMWDLV